MAMSVDKTLKYTENHEWVKVKGEVAYVGISDHAQEELGDIVFVELPELDDEVSKGDEVVNIESVKAAAPVYAPVSGKITEVNDALEDAPETINEAPYDTFIFALELSDASELDDLMNAAAYEAFLKEEE
jgi:glycine cleavage system H protein